VNRLNKIKDDSDLRKMLDELKDQIFAQKTVVSENMELFFSNKPKYVVFLSFSDGNSRAYVTKGIGNSVEVSWKNAADIMKKKIKETEINPIWVKADIVRKIKAYPYQEFIRYISEIKINYFREGISLDNMFNISFLEQEVNSNVFIYDVKDSYQKKKHLVWKNINYYLKRNTGNKYQFDENSIAYIYTFTTLGFFHDGMKCYPLCSEGHEAGRRSIEKVDEALLRDIISNASNFLSNQIDETGKFCYGYFPCFDKIVPHYNILRHASTTYSMLEAYEFNKDPKLKDSIKRALEYLMNEGIELFKDDDENNIAFVIERLEKGDAEIKLGANAAAILAFAKYTRVFHDEKYVPIMQNLAEGIRFCQDDQDGSFVHILNVPDLSVKEKYRIIYYDGEAAFALMRLYDIDKNERWINTVEKAFEHFIKNDYWKHSDHWLSYCSYELMKYKPEQRYIAFNLQNASGILDFCLTRETTYPTLLELLMATYCMIDKLKRENVFLETLESFDYSKFIDAIEHRVKHQLNGLYFPEVAMYFKAPGKILWSFFIRHHSFRARIDDNEHNISGYCSYLHNRLKANEILIGGNNGN